MYNPLGKPLVSDRINSDARYVTFEKDSRIVANREYIKKQFSETAFSIGKALEIFPDKLLYDQHSLHALLLESPSFHKEFCKINGPYFVDNYESQKSTWDKTSVSELANHYPEYFLKQDAENFFDNIVDKNELDNFRAVANDAKIRDDLIREKNPNYALPSSKSALLTKSNCEFIETLDGRTLIAKSKSFGAELYKTRVPNMPVALDRIEIVNNEDLEPLNERFKEVIKRTTAALDNDGLTTFGARSEIEIAATTLADFEKEDSIESLSSENKELLQSLIAHKEFENTPLKCQEAIQQAAEGPGLVPDELEP